MRKRIGILTHYSNCTNYGGLLQAYALAVYLSKKGYDAEQIRYNFEDCVDFDKRGSGSTVPDEKDNQKTASEKGSRGKKNFVLEAIKSKIEYSYIRPYLRNKKQKELDRIFKKRLIATREFEEQIPHSTKRYDKNNIGSVDDKYDIFITGSDQVWNFKWFHPAFFLEFASEEKRKIAYAASAGKADFTEKENRYLQEFLSRYDAISVREENLVPVLNKLLPEKNTEFSVDPVFLLDRADWNLLAAPNLLQQKYLFCYLLDFEEEQWQLANKIAKERKLQLVSIPCSAGWYYKENKKLMGKQLEGIGPREFLSLIKYADYVFTNSFHASAFSIIFDRPFVTLDRNARKGMGSRIKTLTALFECTGQFCDADEKQTIEYIRTIAFKEFSEYPERSKEKIAESGKFLLQAVDE